MQRRIRDLKVKALKAQSECKDLDEIDTQLVRIERGEVDLPQLQPKPEEGENSEALEELKVLIEAERKELSLNPSTFASPIGQLSDHRMAERKVQNWPTEDLKWVLDQVCTVSFFAFRRPKFQILGFLVLFLMTFFLLERLNICNIVFNIFLHSKYS